MNAGELWRRLLAGEPAERPLVDLGATSLGAPGLDVHGADEISDFVGVGLATGGRRGPAAGLAPSAYLAAEVVAECPTPGSVHPLATASAEQVRRLPTRPAALEIRARSAAAEGRERLVAVDPPCPGLLDLCMGMRGPWRFIEDLASDAPVVEAMLDWALETVSAAYLRLLAGIEPPDLVVYGDDLAHQRGPFVSPAEFDAQLAPRMAELFARIRGAVGTPLAILVHTCGDVAPLLPYLVDLGVEALNVQAHLMGGPAVLRKCLPRGLILHGATPLAILGTALSRDDGRTVRQVLDEIAASHPAIVASPDLDGCDHDQDVLYAAEYLRTLGGRPDARGDLALASPFS